MDRRDQKGDNWVGERGMIGWSAPNATIIQQQHLSIHNFICRLAQIGWATDFADRRCVQPWP